MTFRLSLPPGRRYDIHRLWIILGSVPVVSIGLLIVTFAVAKAPWPPDPSLPMSGGTVSYLDRLRGKESPPFMFMPPEQARTVDWYGRRVLDAAMLLVLALGYASIGVAIWWSDQRALIALMAIGGIGMLYGTFIGMYPGPVLTVCGFSLVLFGAGLSWISQCSIETQPPRKKVNADAWTETGFDVYETHSTA